MKKYEPICYYVFIADSKCKMVILSVKNILTDKMFRCNFAA